MEGLDLENRLCKQVGSMGTVEGVYSGFEIAVKNEGAFPWASVLHMLLQCDHEVWVKEQKGKLVIVTQASIA